MALEQILFGISYLVSYLALFAYKYAYASPVESMASALRFLQVKFCPPSTPFSSGVNSAACSPDSYLVRATAVLLVLAAAGSMSYLVRRLIELGLLLQGWSGGAPEIPLGGGQEEEEVTEEEGRCSLSPSPASSSSSSSVQACDALEPFVWPKKGVEKTEEASLPPALSVDEDQDEDGGEVVASSSSSSSSFVTEEEEEVVGKGMEDEEGEGASSSASVQDVGSTSSRSTEKSSDSKDGEEEEEEEEEEEADVEKNEEELKAGPEATEEAKMEQEAPSAVRLEAELSSVLKEGGEAETGGQVAQKGSTPPTAPQCSTHQSWETRKRRRGQVVERLIRELQQKGLSESTEGKINYVFGPIKALAETKIEETVPFLSTPAPGKARVQAAAPKDDPQEATGSLAGLLSQLSSRLAEDDDDDDGSFVTESDETESNGSGCLNESATEQSDSYSECPECLALQKEYEEDDRGRGGDETDSERGSAQQIHLPVELFGMLDPRTNRAFADQMDMLEREEGKDRERIQRETFNRLIELVRQVEDIN